MRLTKKQLKGYIEKARRKGVCPGVFVCPEVLKELSTLTPSEALADSRAPYWAYWYALNVLKRRWPEAEEIIKREACWAYWYAHDVMREDK